MNSIKNELWICELRTHIAKDENSTSYHYYEPIREHTPASPDALQKENSELRKCIGKAYDAVHGGSNAFKILEQGVLIGKAKNKLLDDASRKENPDAVRELNEAATIIIKEAAALITSEDLPSDCAEDYKRKIPKWVLKMISGVQEKQRQRGIRLKQAYDKIRAALKSLAQSEQAQLGE